MTQVPLRSEGSETAGRLREALRLWLSLSDEDLAALPEVSRHDEPQASPQAYDCGCVAVMRVTDRDARRGQQPFEMRLIATCDTPSCQARVPQEDAR